MLVSTSSALAPDQAMPMVMAGRSMVGKNWVLMRAIENAPNRIINTISRLAAFG
jgi:hypothetical protein